MAVPFPQIDADDPIVADLLLSTVDLVREAGGWVNPNATLIAQDGQLSIHCTDSDGLLLRVPREAMVRVDRVTWVEDSERLIVGDVPGDIGDTELAMLYTQVALLNQCEKVSWLAAHHPALSGALTDSTIDVMQALIPSFRSKPITARSLLFVTRCFRIDMEDGEGAQRIVIPLVDLLNHHRGGAVASWLGTSFDVTVARPFGTVECALDYGMARDCLEVAAVYGFVDDSVDIAHSAPVEVDLDGIGRVAVLGSLRTRAGDLEMPVAIQEPGRTLLTGLTFRLGDLDSPVAAVMQATGWSRTDSSTVVESIAGANLALLDDLRATIEQSPPSPAGNILRGAATHQSSIIR